MAKQIHRQTGSLLDLFFENIDDSSFSLGINTSSNDELVISTSDSGDADPVTKQSMILTTDGFMTLPRQTAFLASINTENGLSQNVVNYVGAVTPLTEIVDRANNFTVGDGAGTPAIFTSPLGGTYMFGMVLEIAPGDIGDFGSLNTFYITTTQRDVQIQAFNISNFFVGFSNQVAMTGMIYTNLDVNDTVQFGFETTDNDNYNVIQGYVYGSLIA